MSETIEKAGDVFVEQLYIVSSTGKFSDVRSFAREINLYESIYNPTLSGSLVITDNLNLFKELGILGDEFLVMKIRTPGFEHVDSIQKTFKIYSVSNRIIVDQATQVYTLNFISIEGINDVLNNLHKPYEGTIADIVSDIYENELAVSRNLFVNQDNEGSISLLEDSEKTELVIIEEPTNSVKFISPGWTPTKCLNWLASKSLSGEKSSCSYFFWESNKKFYFGSIEKIFEIGNASEVYSIGTYRYFPPGSISNDDVNIKMFHIEKITSARSFDTLESIMNGHAGSRLIELDIMKKEYRENLYIYSQEFVKQKHSVSELFDPLPLIPKDSYNPYLVTKVYPVQKGLFSNISDNVNEKMKEIYSNRISTVNNLRYLTFEITVPGRTNVEVGSILDLVLPDTSPVDENDLTSNKQDEILSGKYLITKIRHKISSMNNEVRHFMIMEVIKDSFVGEVSVY